MIVKDEEDNICRCLESVKDIVDEIVIVDTGCHDQTVTLAKGYGARVFLRSWDDNFSNARNYALDQARGEWIFVMDADEELDASQADLVRPLLNNHAVDVYFVNVINHINDSVIKQLDPRLFRNHPGFRYSGKINEVILKNIVQAKPDVKFVTSNVVIHRYCFQGF